MEKTVAGLREELSRLHGRTRVPMLVRIGQELWMGYWRTGPGSPSALGDLSGAIEMLDEAYSLLTPADPSIPADPARAQVGFLLGMSASARHGAHGGSEADRDTALTMLAEALSQPGLQPMLGTTARITLAQLYLSRAMEALTSTALRSGLAGGTSASSRNDADAAIRCLREVLGAKPASAEIVVLAENLLSLAESVRPLLSGDLTRLDIGTVMHAMAAIQQVQQRGFLVGIAGLSSPGSFSVDLSLVDPLDYPVMTAVGDPEQAPAVPPRQPAPVPRPPTEPNASRQAARDRLAALVGKPEEPVWEQVRALLEAGHGRVATGDLDAYVSAAANAVDAEEDGDPVESGLDRLLSAVGLCLRQRRDGSGWDDDSAGGGCLSAAEPLLAAAERIPASHPAAAVVVEALGGLLDGTRPLAGAVAGIADRFGEYAGEVAPPRAMVTALGELCRTVTTLATGAGVDPIPLAAAVAAVPADHAWSAMLSIAVEQVRLAAAVRAGNTVAIGVAPDGLAPLLHCLLRDDTEALRAAVDALAWTARGHGTAAVVGAAYLELATRAPAREQADLAAAIRLLSASSEALDDASEGLRTRTWWRLAEAYRRRGAPEDGESSRNAGLEALRGGDQDPRNAARFAGWMLADGRAQEAYTALEIAAAGSGRPESAAGPLVEDVLNVILGIAPSVAQPPDVPAWTDVATALREVGATALLYLHPTDDAGRTAGVLCLDAGTHRLDVLANVPVTDPLTSDDPGWSAIGGRWSDSCLLVAATGNLRRIALSAVRTSDGRRLAQEASVTYVASGTQAIRLAERPVVPAGRSPLFVVNPRGDRDAEMADVLVLRRLFYPRSICVGRALESLDGPGTREDVLIRLPGASLVHLACGVHGGRLHLSGAEVLEATAVRGGGLVILTESVTEGLAGTAESFLEAGFSGVIGWRWSVPAPFTALALFMTHLMLIDRQLPPAVAVTAVQRWMLDISRELPPLLPGAHRHIAETIDLTRPALWAALTYYGR